MVATKTVRMAALNVKTPVEIKKFRYLALHSMSMTSILQTIICMNGMAKASIKIPNTKKNINQPIGPLA